MSRSGSNEGCPAVILAFATIPVVVIVGALMNGWVLTIMWSWFMVPIFGLPELTLVPAIGVAMVISYLTNHHIDTQVKERTLTASVVYAFLRAVMWPLFTLACAWVVQLFM